MILKSNTQQHIRFAKLDQGNAWVVVAVLIETIGNETVISEPKVVKVIPKPFLSLTGTSQKLFLTAPQQLVSHIKTSVVSPYFITLFGAENGSFVIGLAAQPPTR